MKIMLKVMLSVFFLSVVALKSVYASSVVCTKDKDLELKTALKWYRNSAEKLAIYYQVYATGLEYIRHNVAERKLKRHSWGVILDIDETVLDNSQYINTCGAILPSKDFDKNLATNQLSKASAGSIEFTKAVSKLGGYVTFVSNRNGLCENLLSSTIANLKKEGVYFDQIILVNRKSPNSSDKNARFDAIAKGHYNDGDKEQMVWSNTLPPHEIVAYFGDNIQDFPKLKQKEFFKQENQENWLKKFGNGYFIFPNPMYGSWS